MGDNGKPAGGSSRRDFLTLAAGAAAAPVIGTAPFQTAMATTSQPAPAVVKGTGKRGKPNILFIFT